MEPVKTFSTGPVNFKTYVGWPAGQQFYFLQKVFVHYSMHLMKNFQKEGWWLRC